jgi:hypothetical protein
LKMPSLEIVHAEFLNFYHYFNKNNLAIFFATAPLRILVFNMRPIAG